MIVTCSSRCGEHVLEQPPDELQGDVLERQRRPVEQLLEQPVLVVDLHERHDGRVAERRVRVVADAIERDAVDLVADERPHHRRGDVGVVVETGQIGQRAATRPARTARRRSASPASSTSANPSSGARPRVDTYRTSAADHTQQPTDAADDVELAQLAHGRLHVGLARLVGDEHEPGVGADALLLERRGC